MGRVRGLLLHQSTVEVVEVGKRPHVGIEPIENGHAKNPGPIASTHTTSRVVRPESAEREELLALTHTGKPRAVTFDGTFEARLVALACSEAPPG